MKRFALLFALTGCLDSLVDNPCEDGYTLVANECIVVEPDGEQDPYVIDPEVMPPIDPATTPPPALDPVSPTKPMPPESSEPLEPAPPPTEGLTPCPTCE